MLQVSFQSINDILGGKSNVFWNRALTDAINELNYFDGARDKIHPPAKQNELYSGITRDENTAQAQL